MMVGGGSSTNKDKDQPLLLFIDQEASPRTRRLKFLCKDMYFQVLIDIIEKLELTHVATAAFPCREQK
jgi:hypothetical protein